MREKGVFGQALIKLQGKGWLMLVPGKYIDEYVSDKQVGYCKTLEQDVNEMKFLLIARRKRNM